MALLLSRLHKDHWATFVDGDAIRAPIYQFNSDVLTDWLGVRRDDLYNTLCQPAESLSSKRIGIKNRDSKEFDFISLFKRLTYKNATLTIVPNDELINEYLGVSQGHAQVDHKVFRRLKKEHSKRLYPLLCRFKSEHTRLHPITIDELHGFFGLLGSNRELIKTSYANNKVFMERCVRATIKEISECDPKIRFEWCEDTGSYGYKATKKGRKIDKIQFLFKWYQPVNKEESAQRRILEETPSPIGAVTDTYWKILHFVPGLSNNPSVDDLNLMMRYSSLLAEEGLVQDRIFMINFGQGLAEALEFEK